MPRLVFLGVGALGSTTALACRNLEAELVFIDFDRVETKNLAAQSYVKQSLGKNKARALKTQLHNFYGRASEAMSVRVTRDNVETLTEGADLLIDCFDNLESRLLVSEHAREKGLALVHAAISADGNFGIVRWDERFVPDAEDEEGQATCEGGEFLPFIGLVSATLARTIQDFLVRGARRDSLVNLSSVTPTS